MRLNHKSKSAQLVDVYLDGKKIEAPFEADEEQGYVWATDESGQFTHERVRVSKLEGKVEIRFMRHDLVAEERFKEAVASEAFKPIKVNKRR